MYIRSCDRKQHIIVQMAAAVIRRALLYGMDGISFLRFYWLLTMDEFPARRKSFWTSRVV